MSRLVKIAGWGGAARASVIFVHGLGGHAYDTWRRPPDNDTFWPLWLAQDVEGISVYTLAYEAPSSNWLGTSMPLPDRAVNVLEILLSEPSLTTGHITFICHSLGGLIVKQILLDLQQQKDRRPEAADLLERVTQVVFAATPHTGARLGTLLDRLRFLAWPSSIARMLVANDPTLRRINVAYLGLADERRKVLQHRVFYETQGTPAGVIVEEASADPGLPGDPPVPVDADHITIVKPFDRASLPYPKTRDFIAKNPAPAMHHGALEVCPLPPIRSEQSLNVLPKLIRIAAIGLIGLIGYKGVQELFWPENIGPEQLAVKDAQIAALNPQNAALTKMLLGKNPEAGPGVPQAVGAAVGSITQDAAEGNPRLQQALGLLKENKTAEATQLLNAVAEDKMARAEQETAHAEKDRKDAAIAYRNLGAIAGLRDPKKALEVYEKAVALDPDDLASLYWTGAILIDYGDLNKAQARLERVLTLTKTDDQAFYKYWALGGLGDIEQRRGDFAGALKYYNGSLAGFDWLAKSEPGNAFWQHDLSVCYDRIGNVQMAQGDLASALKSYNDGLAIADRQAKADPSNALWQSDLSASYEKIGDVQKAQGELAGALKYYSDGLAIAERQAKADPGNTAWQHNLSASFVETGDVQVKQGDLAGALKSYEDSFAIFDRLAKSDPGNALWQRDLAVSFGRFALAHGKSGDSAKVLDALRQGQAIMAHLTKLSPDNAQWQQDLTLFNRAIAKQAER